MFVPNSAGTYGSAQRILKFPSKLPIKKNTTIGDASFEIKKIHLKRQDKPSEPCTSDIHMMDTTACISKFIQEQIGCRLKNQGPTRTNDTGGLPCQFQLREFADISGKLQYASAATIYNMTGCLSACEKERFDIRTTQIREKSGDEDPKGTRLKLRVSISDTSHTQEEEYIIYDLNSFIADFGGYMGLLLGSSILSIYNEFERFVGTLHKAVTRKFQGERRKFSTTK